MTDRDIKDVASDILNWYSFFKEAEILQENKIKEANKKQEYISTVKNLTQDFKNRIIKNNAANEIQTNKAVALMAYGFALNEMYELIYSCRPEADVASEELHEELFSIALGVLGKIYK